MTPTPNPKQCQLAQRAQALLARFEHINTYGEFEFEINRQRELAYIELMFDLLSGPYLSIKGRQYLEERLDCSQEWADDIEDDDAAEAL